MIRAVVQINNQLNDRGAVLIDNQLVFHLVL